MAAWLCVTIPRFPRKTCRCRFRRRWQWSDIGTDDDPLDCNCFTQPKRKLQWLGETYTSDIDHTGAVSEAIVTLEKPIPPGGSVAIDVQYGGKIMPDSTRLTRMGLPDDLTLRSDWDQISEPFTAVRGLGYVVWYPVSIEAVSMSEGNAVSTPLPYGRNAIATARSSRTSESPLRPSLRCPASLQTPPAPKDTGRLVVVRTIPMPRLQPKLRASNNFVASR